MPPTKRPGVENPVVAPARTKSESGPRLEARDSADPSFNVEAFLHSAGVARRIVAYGRGDVIYGQGDPCDSVLFLQDGGVKISVVSKTGRQAIVAMLGPGDFFGEGGLSGQPVRMATATATPRATVLLVDQQEMVRLLHTRRGMADRLMAYLLARTIRVEEELVDQLFNSSEKRLARKLLLLARYGDPHNPVRALPPISQETLAEFVGTTRSRINFFMKKFERLGLVTRRRGRGLDVNAGLLAVALHD